MKKFLFFDIKNDGHHFLYNRAIFNSIANEAVETHYFSSVDSVKQIEMLNEDKIVLKNIHSDKRSLIEKESYLNFISLTKLLIYAKKNKIKNIHFLYLDSLFVPILILFIFLFPFNITATLHWYPTKKLKQVMLTNFLRFSIINKLVVHGDYTKNKLIKHTKIQPNKVKSIVYPNLHINKENEFTKEKIQSDMIKDKHKRPYLLYFGGLRYDKGIDILLRSLPLVKSDFTLIIAGGESFFKRKDVEDLIRENNLFHKVLMELSFIPDSEVSSYFKIADIVVLPYRKYFTGQSGPLTEGAAHSKIIIGPKSGEIGYTIEQFNLGFTFNSEDYEDLAKTIEYALSNLEEISNNKLFTHNIYKNLLNIDYFSDEYKNFFI